MGYKQEYNPLSNEFDLVNPGGGGGGGDEGFSDAEPVIEAALCELNANNEAIDPDNAGDLHCSEIDMDNLPKVCGYPMFIIASKAPDKTPDFIGQFWIDILNGNVYIAKGVARVDNYIRINN